MNVSMRPLTLPTLLLAAVLTACGGGGGGGGSTPAAGTTGTKSQAAAPNVVVEAQSGATAGTTGTALQASVGSTIILASASTAAPGTTLAGYQWALTALPDNSQVALANTNTATVTFVPDLAGNYTLQLTVTDSQGQTATQSITISVTSSPPTAQVVTKVVFNDSSVTRPTQFISLGATVAFDASQAVTTSDDPVGITYSMLQVPASSAAALSINGVTAHFVPDVVGTYEVDVRATHAAGDYVDAIYVFSAQVPPSGVVVAQTLPAGQSQTATISTYTNYSVVLDSSNSGAPTGDTLTRSWSLASTPNLSNARLSSNNAAVVNFTPDVAGVYVVVLTVTDQTTGAVSTFTETVIASNGPTAVVSGSSEPVAQVAAPTLVSSAGVPVTLKGDGSYDAGGGTLTYQWQLTQTPNGSRATIPSPNGVDVTFTPDINGTYKVALTVTNTSGLSNTLTATINVGGIAPTAVVDQPQLALVLGGTATVSAAASFDPNLLPLTYQWSLQAAPTGSSAGIGTSNTSTLSFTPDVAGTYTLSVTVNNGTLSSVTTVTLTAFAPTSGTVPLDYVPQMSAYSPASGKAIIVSTNPNALHIVDPAAGTDVAVPLPAGVKAIAMSPDGQLAGVLHEGVVSLIDVVHGWLLESVHTNGSQTMVAVRDSGVLYLSGQTGGQWVEPGLTSIDAYNGNAISSSTWNIFYGTVNGIYSDVTDKLFVISSGLSPAQTYAIDLDTSGDFLSETGSPYWGDYAMSAPFWLSGDQSLLFTGQGTYFSTTDLHYVGTFGVAAISLSHSSILQEASLLPQASSNNYYYESVTTYPSSYKRFTTSLLFPAPDVPLPTIAGQQTYGIAVYYTSSATALNSHVILVQTGTNQANGTGASYYLLLR